MLAYAGTSGVDMGNCRISLGRRFFAGLSVLTTIFLAASYHSQSAIKDVEWRSYGADLANTHYIPLDQINAGNFNRLQVAWQFRTDNLGPRQETNLQSTPL